MSKDQTARERLLALEGPDIRLIAEMPGLGESWARRANVNRQDLIRLKSSALTRVKTATIRNTREFVADMLQFWEANISRQLSEMGDADDLMLKGIRMTAATLGSGSARAMVACLASTGGELGLEADLRMEELTAAADDPVTDEEMAPYIQSKIADLDSDVVETLRAAAGPPPASPAAEAETDPASHPTSIDAANLLEECRRLRAQGSEIAALLREQAQDADKGRPATQSSETGIGEWSEHVRSLLLSVRYLVAAEDLTALECGLRALADAQATRAEDARKALKTIEFLRSQGLEGPVVSTLAELGFESEDEARQVAGVTDPHTTTTAVAESNVAAFADETAEQPLPEPDVPRTEDSRLSQPETSHEVGIDHPKSKARADECARNAQRAPAEPSETVSTHPIAGAATKSAPAAQHQSDSSPAPADTAANRPGTIDHGSGLPDFPWDDPTPPLIGRLILDERYALACHIAAATEDTQRHQSLLRLTLAAARSSRDVLELALPQLIPDDDDVEQFDTDEVRVLLAGALRAGLRLGYAPLGLATLIDRAELADTGLASSIHALAVAVQRGRTRENDQSSAAGQQLAARWTALGQEATEYPNRLAMRRLIYQRSSRVLHHLAREAQPIGRALRTAAELIAQGIDGASSNTWNQLDDFAAELRVENKRERLINGADRDVSTSPNRRNPIIAQARTQLHEELAAVGDFLDRVQTVRRAILNADDIKGVETAQDIDRALAQVPEDEPASTVGSAAILDLIRWRRAGEVSTPAASGSVDELLDRELLALFELPRDDSGSPTRRPTASEVTHLLEPRAHETVIAGHLAKGDIAAARAYIDDHALDGQYDDDILRAARDGQRHYDAALLGAERSAARLRALYQDDLARTLTSEIDQLRSPQTDRWDLAVTALNGVTERGNSAIRAVHDDLRARARAVDASETDRARIIERLQHGDEALALEFVTMLESHQQLPNIVDDHGDDFTDFYPAVVNAAADAQAAGHDPLIGARNALSATTMPDDRQLRDGLAGWKTLKRAQRRDANAFRLGVAQLLRMVGLVPRSTEWMREVTRMQRSGYATYRVKASPVDRSYVPELGTHANGSYDITFVWDKVTPARLLDFIDERARTTQPNVIFYFGVLDARARVQLRNLTLPGRGKGFSPLVIDEAVVAWLTSREEPGWRFTQRVTLPFTTINPYTPFASGEVPEEVFVGRDDERRRVESPTGSMFVYGGRQLGKSALLRRVERKFNESSPQDSNQPVRTGNVAIYIDLKAAGIGEAKEPATLWPLLGERLKQVGVIPQKAPRTAKAQDVTAHIKAWIDAEAENRLILLLDEADNFLTVDADAGDSSARGAFPVLQALKGIMESTQRRFKPVFAGLHQVQRFHDASNTPVAHGGADIPIGPLKSSDAYSLVADPMSALGYRFGSPELVWQLLLVTNYQASLIQIVCEALVRHMQPRSLPADGGRIVIEERDVRSVCEDDTVQALVAQRFRWTINLDSRYRVIALVVALLSRAVNQPASTFSIDDLREYCETFWQEGFSREQLSGKEFERYLDEMVGLGVLHRQNDHFGLRSPSIVRMLGRGAALEQELQDASMHLEPVLEYNPVMMRQILGDSAGFWQPRSPLTDHELAQLFKGETHSVRIVLGSPALAVERVATAIQHEADSRGIVHITSNGSDLADMTGRRFGKPTHIIVDLSRAPETADLSGLVGELANRANLTSTIIAGPQMLAAVDALPSPVVELRRWSRDGLRAWHDSHFDSPVLRERLHRVTSGWPKLVEEAMLLVKDGRSADDALTELARRLTTAEYAARMLADTAVDQDVARSWATWFGHVSPEDGLVESEPVSVSDLNEALGQEAEPVLAVLEALDLVSKERGGWVLDRVVIAAATSDAHSLG